MSFEERKSCSVIEIANDVVLRRFKARRSEKMISGSGFEYVVGISNSVRLRACICTYMWLSNQCQLNLKKI